MLTFGCSCRSTIETAGPPGSEHKEPSLLLWGLIKHFCVVNVCKHGAALKGLQLKLKLKLELELELELERSAMAALRTLALLSFGVSGGQLSDCSYYGLLKHLNLTTPSQVLQIMRPVQSWNHTTDVFLDMVMYGILDVDEKHQAVTSHIWTETHWKNTFLTWNPSDFCGTDKLTLPKSLVWSPDVGIDEDASDSGSIREDPLLILMSSGEAVTTTRQRLTSTCQLNLLLFPFDVQRCNITFSSTSYDASSLKLGTARSSSAITSLSDEFMITQGEWKLKNMEVFLYDHFNGNISISKLRYTVWLERKPMLYVINLILPLFYLLILDLASFFISESSGEKLGFKVTILLSISVLLLILNDILPSTEDKLPMIATYCVSVFTVVWLSVLEAMLVGFLTNMGGFCCEEDRRSGDLQLDAVRHEEPGEKDAEVKAAKKPLPLDGLQDLLKGILEDVRAVRQDAARQDAARQDQANPREGRFRRMARIIDGVFFLVYFLVVATFFFYLCIVWMNS